MANITGLTVLQQLKALLDQRTVPVK